MTITELEESARKSRDDAVVLFSRLMGLPDNVTSKSAELLIDLIIQSAVTEKLLLEKKALQNL